MKKCLAIWLGACILLAALGGCVQNNADSAGADDKISVVTTIFAPYDFAREVAGAHAEVTMLLPPGSESHSFDLTPQDVIKIQNCDVFIYVGGDSDAWVDRVLASVDTDKMRIITLMDCVEVVAEEIVEGMEHDHDHDDHDHDDHNHYDDHDHNSHDGHGEYDEHHNDVRGYDEHVWTSPKNAKLIVQKIADVLCEADAANGDAYRENTAAYLAKLDELDAKFQAIVDSAVRRTLVFGDRFPFRYFADAYGLSYFAAFPGCSTKTGASNATIIFLIEKVKAEGIPVVFHVELSNQEMANTISEATGAEVLLFHACHNVTRDEIRAGVSYLELMHQNAENLKEALQ